LAYYAIDKEVDLQNEEALTKLAFSLPVRFSKTTPESPHLQVYLNDRSVTVEIRTENYGSITSKIARFPKVRGALLAIQRSFAKEPGLIADGRDMGTIVFPDAKIKFFLEASVEERARRRYMQLKVDGLDVNLTTIAKEIAARDQQDRERAVSPMKPAAGAIDTTHIGVEDVFADIMSKIRKHINLA